MRTRTGHLPSQGRRGNTSIILVALLSGILLSLVVLIVVIVTQGRTGDASASGGSSSDKKITADELDDPPEPPEPIRDPKRIQETARVGKTYRSVLKAGFDARVEDKDWSVKQIVNLGYAAEFVVNRTIEENDGETIVELRHFETARGVKLLAEVEELTVELGTPGVVLLGALEYIKPGSSAQVLSAKPVFETVARWGLDARYKAETAKAFGRVDGISGKTVRITFEDGKGITSVEPVGCSLTTEEQEFIFTTAVLSDYYIMPNLEIEIGGKWSVDGSQFATFFDPSWRATSSGTVVVVRDSDHTEGGKRFASLRIDDGTISLDASDESKSRVGQFMPSGVIKYSLDEGHVQSGSFEGRFDIEQVSKDHLLFEARFRTRPTLKVNYNCEMR